MPILLHWSARRALSLCVALALGLAWPGGAGAQSPETSSIARLETAELAAALEPLIHEALRENNIPGASIAITQDDRVVLLAGYGVADIESGAPVDPERTLFRVASVSKPFIWMSVLQARDRGLLNLDEDVNAYLDFTIPDAFPGRPITLRHLMTHTAGFEDMNIGASVRSAAERQPLGETLRRMLPQRTAAPGARTAYSNYGTGLAGYIVERVSGTPLPEHLEANIFTPLAMTRTSMRQPPPDIRDLAAGHTLRGAQIVRSGFEYMNLYPNGAMSTTAADMARFALAQLGATHDPEMLAPTSWREMQTRQFGNIAQGAGLTLGFEQSRWNGHTAIGHGGDIAGYKTHFLMFPEQRISIFISFNSDQTGNAGVRILSAFADRYLPGADDFLFARAPVENATDEVAGSYVPTRRNSSTIERLFWPMAMGVSIRRLSDTEIEAHFLGRDRRYRRESSGVYVPIETDEFGILLARASAETGNTEIFFSQIGAFMFERPPAHENLALHARLLPAALGLGLLGAVLCVIGAIGFARRRTASMLGACALAAIGAVAAFAFIPLILERFTPDLVYGVSMQMRALFALPLIGLACAIASLALLAHAWRKQKPPLLQIIGIVSASVGVAIFAWQLSVWNMLGFGGLPA